MDDKQITRFGLIRHAQTLWNQEGRIQGHCNSALTDSGKHDAVVWGKRLKRFAWDRIFGSDLERAVDTAAIINRRLKIPFDADARLREQDWGEWTAKPTAKIISEELDKLDEAQRSGWQFCPPGGEDRISVWQRSHNALLSAARKWPGNTILVVTHEGVIKSLIYRLCNRMYAPGEASLIEARHLHCLVVKNRELRLDQINALNLGSTSQK